jgi:hypothetical protein
MANLNGTPTYQDFVRQLETTDPSHPDTWNPNFQTLINNDVHLQEEISKNERGITGLEAELVALGTSDPVEIKTAVNLDWLYNQNRIAFELFSSTYSLRDLPAPITGVATVTGDDSIDIDDTSTLEIGHQYVVHDATSLMTVEVAEIFSATRFRAAAAATASIAAGQLSSTNIDMTGTVALAAPGDVYFAHGVNLANVDPAACIIRHTGAPGALRLYYRDDTHLGWTEAYWKWRRDIATGTIDTEYTLPTSGYFDLQISSQATGDTEIHHLVCVTADTGLEGTHHAPETPINQTPLDGAVDVQETPTLSASTYTSLAGSGQYAKQIQLASSSAGFDDEIGFDAATLVHDSALRPAGTSYGVPAGELTAATEVFWSIRYQDAEGAWSRWSQPTGLTTAATFEYIVTPTNSSPAADATDVPEQPTLSTGTFESYGFEPIALSDGVANLWTASATVGEFYYTGLALAGRPSAVYAGGVKLAEQDDPGALADGQWAWGDVDTLGAGTVYIKTAAGDPDAQAAGYASAGEVHLASRYRIRQSAGDYVAPAYDSGETTDLTSHQVPAGILAEGQTVYYFQASHQGQTLGWSDWSTETGFTTKDMFAQIFGIALAATGGGAGSWQQVDEDGNNVTLALSDFNNHPVWGGMTDVVVDGQDMVQMPKFYVRQALAPAGSDQAGRKCWWVSDIPADGFALHPAFMDTGVAIDQIYVGSYECVADPAAPTTKAASQVGLSPLVSIDFPTMQTRCAGRNEVNGGDVGVGGFHLWSIYDLAAVQLLALIELGTPDVQSAIAAGNVSTAAAANTGATAAVWRGIHELWGNVYHMTDGLLLDGAHQVQVWDTAGDRSLVSTGITSTSANGWGVTLHDEAGPGFDLGLLFLPKTTDATEANGSLADYLVASDSVEDNVCYHGGHCVSASQAGLFFLNLYNEAAISNTIIGGRLAKW